MPADQRPLLVSPEDLAQRNDDPARLIVDLSDPGVHEAGHVPGAIHLDYESLLHAEPPVLGLVPDAATLGRTLAAVGIDEARYVIAYDDEGNARAARLLWMLAALGHPAHALLDGGLTAWRAGGFPLEQGPSAATPTTYQPVFQHPELIASCDEVRAAIDDPSKIILDNRSPAEYAGDNIRAARAGHIPGAVNLDWVHAMDHTDLRLKPIDQLRADFEALGVTPDRKVITHCQTHHRSSLTLFVLRYLGYSDISGYAGSWSEWGNREDTPIAGAD
jgi:thiosulfate/3-mercaptopyruvate sulfurtransferase